MSKKVLSLLLIAAILLTSTLFSGVIVTAETETKTWAVGDQPYAVPGKSSKIEVYDAASATFYDDFVIPTGFNFEKSTVTDTTTLISSNSFQLNRANKAVATSTKDYAWMELTTETDGVNENAYGGKGNSVRVYSTDVGYKHPDGTYLNCIRNNGYPSINCGSTGLNFPSFDDIAISFWVKTEAATKLSLVFWDTNTNSGKNLYSDYINIPTAGEYIVVVPLTNFHVASTAYVKCDDISNFKMYCMEIFFNSPTLENGEPANIYFDNIGVYPIKPNFKSANLSEVAKVVDSFDDYTQTATKTVTSASKAGYKWESTDGVCGSVNVIDNNGDRSILYTATTYFDCTAYNKDTTKINTIKATDNNYELKNSYFVNNGSLAIHVKASKATTIRIQTNNMSYAWSAWAERQVPAGESIVRIPLSEFVNDNKALTRMRKIIISFYSTLPSTLSGTTGTFEIDDISFEPAYVEGDVNNDKVSDILDLVTHNEIASKIAAVDQFDLYNDSKIDARDAFALRRYLLGASNMAKITPVKITQDSFVLSKRIDDNWIVGNEGSFSIKDNAPLYYSGENDTSAIVFNYKNISAYKGSKIVYNVGFANPYETDGVFGFWVYSEQPVSLRLSYMDDSKTEGGLFQCRWVTENIPAGESFVTLDMAEYDPSSASTDYKMQYNRVYQFQINVWSNNNTKNSEGTLYLDSFGFYDKDTTNNIPAAE